LKQDQNKSIASITPAMSKKPSMSKLET
jgi:hypothetical protein